MDCSLLQEECLKEFIENQIKAPSETKTSLFDTIPRGLKKEKKQEKKIDVLKKDHQAFGLLVGNVKTPEEALAHPLTTIPLALANPYNSFQQVSKATLRNHLAEESKVLCDVTNEEADWFTDGMAAVNAVNVAETWEDYGNKFLEFSKPKSKVTHCS